MKKKNKFFIAIISIFVLIASITTFVSFSSNTDTQEVIVKSITPLYDSNSTVVVENNNVVFNDKNQVVEYKVVIENTQNYDIKINDITLSTPTEEFLTYEVKSIEENDILNANSTKELTIYLETKGIKGWGRNFSDELTANISFEKVVKEVAPPTEDKEEAVEPPKEETKQPEKPVASTEDLINKVDKIEIIKVTKDTIEFKENPKLEKGDKIAVWLYSDPIFLGYFDVVETNGIKQIVGLEEALKQANVKEGEHNIVLVSPENETIGYVEVYVNENKNLSSEPIKEDDGKVENPHTSDKGLFVILVAATAVTGLAITVVSKNKFAKYTVFILMLSPVLSTTNAENPIELSINNNVSFESQNVMKPSGWELDDTGDLASMGVDYWAYAFQLKNFYIQNDITEIEEYEYEFDVTNDQSGRVMAYLVEYKDNSVCMDFEENDAPCYDLYLQADGIIYPNEDASFYFFGMMFLNSINNLEGMDTGNVTDMSYMFSKVGYSSTNFTLDLGDNFDTSNVTNMSYMFSKVGYSSTNFTLDLGDKFDTSKVTDMSHMFSNAGFNSDCFTLDLGDNFDISNVTNMSKMFTSTGFSSANLNISLTIKNPNTNVYSIFGNTALVEGSKITVNYTNLTKGIANRMVNTKSYGANVVLGNMVEEIKDEDLTIGDEVEINGEYFNVMSITEDKVTLLPQYNLENDYRQSSLINNVRFANTNGWEYTPGPKEIDIQTWTTNPKTYVNAYVEYLKEQLGDDTVTGDLITLKDLEELGCTVPSDYGWGSGRWNCSDSPYGWIANGQHWWTRSAYSTNSRSVWRVSTDGNLNTSYYDYGNGIGVRPVITISKDTLRNLS